MEGRRSAGFSRRAGLAGALALVALAIPQAGSAAVIMQRGMVGGGLVKLEHGFANVSLLATKSTFPDQHQVVVGSILWVETGTHVSLASIDLTSYEDLPGEEAGRRIEGTLSVNGTGQFPFVLDVIDGGPPGSGKDTIALTVGDDRSTVANGKPVEGTTSGTGDSFRYQASGNFASGDIQDVDLDLPID
jgi:hypothetical protein